MAGMATTAHREHDLAIHLDHLRAVRFVRDIRIAWEPKPGVRHIDALVTLDTPRRAFKLGLEIRQTFLDRTATSALIAEHLRVEREHHLPLLLAARYVPRPTGERLADAGVNFVDRVGNIHLRLGDDYHVFMLGHRDPRSDPAARRVGPALVQLLFQILADPATADWAVRPLADAAGIGRTAAAEGRRRLIIDKVLRRDRDGAYSVSNRKKLADQFVDGYTRVLRAHLLIGRFRAPERRPEQLLGTLAHAAKRADLAWAVTGATAAYALQRFYRDDQLCVFIAGFTPGFQRELRLVPDRDGPVVLLRAFGRHDGWRTIGDLTVAHPWLVYAELVHRGEPRALEAADHLREEYLQP
jgi:hypothetical protein